MADRRPAVIVSACLLGVECTHRGAERPGREHPEVAALAKGVRLIAVCPEVAGGLPTPRPAAERDPDGRVRTAAGEDVTWSYRRGAAHAVALATAAGAVGAVLKARSPSCGCHEIYDGTHSETLVAGRGVTAESLQSAGVPVVSEEDVAAGGDLPWAARGV